MTSRRLPIDDETEVLWQSLAHSHLSTYLWEPWIAVVSADLTAAFENELVDGYDKEVSLTGDFSLAALPLSHYPFELFYSAVDSRFKGDFSGSDYTSNRAGLSGRAMLSDKTSLDYLVSHDQIDRHNYGNLTAQRADATLRHRFETGQTPLNITEVGSTLSYYNTDFDNEREGDRGNNNQSLTGSVSYRASPTETVNHDFRTTLISDKAANSQHRFDRLSAQGVGTVQWRSPSNAVIATGAVRVLEQQIDYDLDMLNPDTDSALTSANAGVSWRVTDQLTMSLGGRANAHKIETVTNERFGPQLEPAELDYGGGVLGSIDYRSLPHEVAGFNWHWDARADADFGYRRLRGPRCDPSDGLSDLFEHSIDVPWTSFTSASISHAFDRTVELPWVSTVTATILQEVGLHHESDYQAFEPIITHSASILKSFENERGSSYFRLYVRDTHGFGEEAKEFQTAQIDFSQQAPIGVNQILRGDLSLQGVHQRFDQNRFYYRVHELEDIYISARANLAYEYFDLFGVDGLMLLSELRVNLIGMDDLAHDWQDDLDPDLFRNDWRNQLQYNVGELWLSLEGTLFQEDGKLGHYVRFAGRRSFDTAD